ncbi:hypothetical protein [Candidatus Pelagibacter sp.]|uniref:hypothetical protein n=1 Tax=Candidatus Pelagibacter sp. TaxID=2024849 RepID=UPI003F862EE5
MNAYALVSSTVKKFSKEFNDIKLNIFMDFKPLPPEFNLGHGLVLGVVINKNKEWNRINYFVKLENDKLLSEWYSLDTKTYDAELHKWSEKAYKIISKQLGFGVPFEIVDLTTLNTDGLIDDNNGNVFISEENCKKL